MTPKPNILVNSEVLYAGGKRTLARPENNVLIINVVISSNPLGKTKFFTARVLVHMEFRWIKLVATVRCDKHLREVIF